MRPIILIGFAWTLGSGALPVAQIIAQSPQDRPTNLRSSGVITRAAPPNALGGNATQATASPASPQFPPPIFPAVPSGESSSSSSSTSSTSSALSDQAWTSTPAKSPATARLADAPTPNQVLPAHFNHNTGQSGSAASSSATAPANSPIRLANHQASVGDGAAGREPRPLKPPTSAESKVNAKGTTGTVQMFVSVLSSLAIVIGLILASFWFYRKAAPTMSGALPKQVVQVLGRTPLAPRQQLVLLRLGPKLVLVSNLHGEVRTISEITDPLEVDRLAGLCESAQPGSISDSFRSVLHNMGRNG